MLQQQKSINTEIRFKLEAENTFLKENLIKAQKDLEKAKKNIIKINKDESELRFLYLKSKYGHQCKKSFTKQKLFKVGTPEYKKCVLSKAEKNN